MTIELKALHAVAGDPFDLALSLPDVNGRLTTLPGYSIDMYFRRSASSDVLFMVSNSRFTLLDELGDDDENAVAFVPAQETILWPPGIWFTDLRIVTPDGISYTIPEAHELRLRMDVILPITGA